ncbi:uncharacterized protein LOC122501507 isoform X2 [Leptopilina heterotoma]|uniref:uncharacterized protein LOC122501507 isoform X2 n=1 Tax=Leptopilina heterotoma TaxID=63436 RepID=UPI001CA7E7AB|nr:uncharacterized protein LOC122501507 isoform X2 [Leptopilina heterotoma]
MDPGANERLNQIAETLDDKIHDAKNLIQNTVQPNASPLRIDEGIQGRRIKSEIVYSSSSPNSSSSDESNTSYTPNRLQSSRSRRAHKFPTNDANNIGEYKLTVIVGNQSLNISGRNFHLVKTAKEILEVLLSGNGEQSNSEVNFFSPEEEAAFSPVDQSSPQIYSNVKVEVPSPELSPESNAITENGKVDNVCTNPEPTEATPEKSGPESNTITENGVADKPCTNPNPESTEATPKEEVSKGPMFRKKYTGKQRRSINKKLMKMKALNGEKWLSIEEFRRLKSERRAAELAKTQEQIFPPLPIYEPFKPPEPPEPPALCSEGSYPKKKEEDGR